ncbi:DNA topoisomerase [Catellatospora sp. IY07-71]|uniref:DNA topoisomerase IB n=1 Tax=Catellatospora sp. IY07-71 TaxID=2728827 RepID=UPI001BB2FB8A|nr:DNA topoisomerase IB [Catellatospora sp. IY07-71]BCJ76477.1 DNA topoisomerase [Catellatospora sp. IY07-71]
MRLRRSDLSRPGISRRRRGRGFSYSFQGKPVTDPDTLARIRALAVPPAWSEVWISPDERGHIQAIGIDAAGRRQYRYHDQWRAQRDRRKFAHLADLAAALPRLRAAVTEDLSGRGLTRRRVLAAAVRLLDRTAVRVGGEQYAVDDPDLGEATFGVATIRRDHVKVRGDEIMMSFPAKGGIETMITVEDAAVATVIRNLLRRDEPGEELLAYREGREWRDVRSDDVNDYLREISGAEITAKDFRTWHGTVAALVSLCAAGRCRTVTARRKAVTAAMREAADLLGNTPAVARASYVDPRLVDAYGAGALPSLKGLDRTAEQPAGAAFADAELWAQAEKTVIDILT